MKKLQLALPVMLHFGEAEVLTSARERLTSLGDSYGVPLDVGAFLLFLPNHARKPENFQKQLEEQRKHRLPIRLVETGVQRQNSLAYGPGDPTYNPQVISDLESVIEQTASLRDLDPTAPEKLVVAPHVGVLVFDQIGKGDFSKPGFYSVEDFSEIKDKVYQRAKDRFGELEERATRLGLRLALENAYSAVAEDVGHWQGQKGLVGVEYQAFNDLNSLFEISRGNLVFDAGHFAAMESIPNVFRENSDVITPESLFSTMGINSWKEFSKKAGNLEDYLDFAKAIHLSSQDRIGIRVPPETEAGRRWGDGSRGDMTSLSRYKTLLKAAINKNLPVAIEEDYVSPGKKVDFIEADRFLKPILQYYSQ